MPWLLYSLETGEIGKTSGLFKILQSLTGQRCLPSPPQTQKSHLPVSKIIRELGTSPSSAQERPGSAAVSPEMSLIPVQNLPCTSGTWFCSSYVTGTALVAVSERRACALGPCSSLVRRGTKRRKKKKIPQGHISSVAFLP